MTIRSPTIEVDGEIFLTPVADSYGTITTDVIRRSFRDRARTLSARLTQLIDELSARSIQQRAFVRQSMRALQDAYYHVFSLGALSVDAFHVLTPADMDLINEELMGEKEFLRAFGTDIRRHEFELDPAIRASLYLRALRGVFELGRVAALPPGPYDWILGDTDHCASCSQASFAGPYRKDSKSKLNLPVIPGIPGSGAVCEGLTRCGCTLRLWNFPANEELQLDLRDILIDVTE
jgi:hypothetical protein